MRRKERARRRRKQENKKIKPEEGWIGSLRGVNRGAGGGRKQSFESCHIYSPFAEGERQKKETRHQDRLIAIATATTIINQLVQTINKCLGFFFSSSPCFCCLTSFLCVLFSLFSFLIPPRASFRMMFFQY